MKAMQTHTRHGRHMIAVIILTLLAACATSPRAADTFTPAGLISGSVMSEEACRWPDTSVWVVVDGGGECVRYFHARLGAHNKIVHVWFHGDRLMYSISRGASWVPSGWYDNAKPGKLARHASRQYSNFAIPYIRFSRPGTYGSSGDHKQRRLKREADVVQAALDVLKRRYAIETFALSGQSGGGHVVASLLARRSDILCAVITSGVVSVRERAVLRGWQSDATGYNSFYDPVRHAGDIPRSHGRRIFIVGDPRDRNVPFATQQSYFRALQQAGHRAWLIRAAGRGAGHHSLASVGSRIVKWCVDGMPAVEMRRQMPWRDGDAP